MTLVEVCEPLFLYVCRLNRSARKGGSLDFSVVRGEVLALFDRMGAAAASAGLTEQYAKIEMPLVFFVDSMIAESRLGFASTWHQNRLAYERNELAGDEKFYDLLEENLKDTSRAATERLLVFYTCMGLGFTGWYAGQPEYLERKMKEVGGRLREFIKSDMSARICPEAYANVDTRNLIEPPGKTLVGIAIALIGLVVALFVTNVYLYWQASRDLSRALDIILAQDRVPSETQAPRRTEGGIELEGQEPPAREPAPARERSPAASRRDRDRDADRGIGGLDIEDTAAGPGGLDDFGEDDR